MKQTQEFRETNQWLADVSREFGDPYAGRTVVVTGADAGVLAVKNEHPHVRAGLSLGEDLEGAPPWHRVPVRLSELFPARRLQACGADFVAVEHRLADLNVLRYCARVGLPAWVWTVDDDAHIARFLDDPRVSVLITNHPDRARSRES